MCLIAFPLNFHFPLFFFVSIIPAGAHLNPAVTLSFCVLGKVSWSRLVPYFLSQVVGAFVASGIVYLVYYGLSFYFLTHINPNLVCFPRLLQYLCSCCRCYNEF